jgi:uncharacterized protein YycO
LTTLGYIAAGQPAPPTVAGDFVLTHGSTLLHKGIRAVQAVRFRGARRTFAYWNHVAMIVGPAGEIVEAHASGVRRANLNVEYLPCDALIIRLSAGRDDRRQAIAFAESCIGNSYSFVSILGLIAWTIFGGRLIIGLDGTEMCSGLVGQALCRYGTIFPLNPAMLLPAHIAEFYNAPGGVQQS